ncbi:MAG: histidine phosphatase family protein [Candidatus Woesearchaeota archaeon]
MDAKDPYEGTKLILVRHGETELNKLSMVQGADSSLSELGIKQAQALGKRLSQSFNIDLVCCSTLYRAKQTADKITKIIGCNNITYSDSLVERSCGSWLGKSWQQIYEENPDLLKARKNLLDFTPEGGETLEMVEKRMMPFIEKIIEENKGKNILIVSHGTALRALLGYYLGIDYGRRYLLSKENCSISIVEYYKGRFTVPRINDHAHIEGIIDE